MHQPVSLCRARAEVASVYQALGRRRSGCLLIRQQLPLQLGYVGVRALMTALDSIYEVKDRRPFWERMAISVGLAAMVIVALFLIAAVLLVLSPTPVTSVIVRVGLTLLRLVVSAGILVVMVALLLRFTTPAHLQVKWVTLGSSLSVVIWLAASGSFGW